MTPRALYRRNDSLEHQHGEGGVLRIDQRSRGVLSEAAGEKQLLDLAARAGGEFAGVRRQAEQDDGVAIAAIGDEIGDARHRGHLVLVRRRGCVHRRHHRREACSRADVESFRRKPRFGRSLTQHAAHGVEPAGDERLDQRRVVRADMQDAGGRQRREQLVRDSRPDRARQV